MIVAFSVHLQVLSWTCLAALLPVGGGICVAWSCRRKAAQRKVARRQSVEEPGKPEIEGLRK